jgi:hypothetical protein
MQISSNSSFPPPQVQRAGIPPRLIPQLLDAIGEGVQPPHPHPACVLYSAFTLCDDLLIRPLRLRLTGAHSVRDFVASRVHLSPRGGDDAPPKHGTHRGLMYGPEAGRPAAVKDRAWQEPLAPLDEFLSAYALYCLETDVEPVPAEEVVRAITQAGIGLAVHRYSARQVSKEQMNT